MSFLDSMAHRPSCVVSALPKRFREVLEKDLAGTVALTTCAVEELETAVRLRGATIAVVGASRDSIEVAERLSHGDQTVKVFLAHYRDGGSASAPLNGFAGVFDLRNEPEKLAAKIRQTATDARPAACPPAPSVWRPRRRALSHFIDMQKNLHNPAALYERTVEAFLDLAGASNAILVLPEEMGGEQFRIAAAQGEDVPAIGQTIGLSRSCLRAVINGETVNSSGAIALLPGNFLTSESFGVAVPVMVNGEFRGCLLADQMTESAALDDFMEAASFLFHLLAKNERTARREKIVAEARQKVSTSWILTDLQGRVMHREGPAWSRLAATAEVTEPRLRDALARCGLGRAGLAKIGEHRIICRELRSEGGSYYLLESPEVLPAEPSSPGPRQQNQHAAIKARLADLPREKLLLEKLLDGISAGSETNFDLKKELAPFDIGLANTSTPPASGARGSALILLAVKIASGQPVTGKFFHGKDAWHLTVEVMEKNLSENNRNWLLDDLIAWSLAASELPILNQQSCLFGIQVKFRSAPGV